MSKRAGEPSPGTSWWCSPACRGAVSPPWPSTPSTRRASGGMWSPCPPMPGCFWGRWRSPTWTTSTASPPPSPSTKRPPARIPAPPWAPSRRSMTTSAFCGPGWEPPTAPSAARRFASSPWTRSSTRFSPCPRAPAFRCWPLWSGEKGEHVKVLDNARKSGYVRCRVDGGSL